MKGKTAFDAMGSIDPRYILEAAPDAPVRKESKAPYLRILAVAATVAALTAVAIMVSAMFVIAGSLKRSDENPPVVPPVDETRDGQITSDGETDRRTDPSSDGRTDAPTDPEAQLPEIPSGAFTTPHYIVEEIDGKYYLRFTEEIETLEVESDGIIDSNNCVIITGIRFGTVEELKARVLTGDFSEDTLRRMKGLMDMYGYEVPNIPNLYEPIIPEGWSSPDGVDWYGRSFYVDLRNDERIYVGSRIEQYIGENGYYKMYDDKSYEKDYEDAITDNRDRGTLREDMTEYDGVPCEVYEYATSVASLRVIILKLERDGDVKEIAMTYCLDHTKDPDMIDPDHPRTIEIFGEKDGIKYSVYLSSMKTVPSIDFLSSFGIKPVELIK